MFVVDTYNVVHAGQAMGGAMGNLSVLKLCRWIAGSAKPLRVTLVMDGRAKPDEPGENEFPDINLVYSGTGVSADTVIGQMVERGWSNRRRSGKGGKICVVSNDRAVIQQAKKNYAVGMSCETFLEMLLGAESRGRGSKGNALPAKKTGGAISEAETEEWLREFGITPPAKAVKPQRKTEEGDLDIEKLMGG